MLGNGEFLEREAASQALAAKQRAERAAMTPEQLLAEKAFKAHIAQMNIYMLLMNTEAPDAKLPLKPYHEKMRQASMAGDWTALNILMVMSKFRWGPNTPLGMYRFLIKNGRKIYVPFTDVELARLFQIMAGAENKYGYNRFREPGATCDWNHLLDLYVNNQEAHKKQYPNTDWRHVVPIYPGRYICQVYRPSTWVKIRKPVMAAVAIVGAIYLGPIIAAKMGEASAAAAGGTTGGTAGAATGAEAVAKSATFLQKVQKGVEVYNKVSAINSIVHGELPAPPIGISGSTFTEWAVNIAKEEVKKEITGKIAEKAGAYVSKKLAEKEAKKQEAQIRVEVEALQRELARLTPKDTPPVPSPLLDPPIRNKIIEMQNVEMERARQNKIVMFAAGVGGALLVMG
jgi:hypothetical protein